MSSSYSTPKYQLNDAQSIQRLIQSITFNVQKIAQNVGLIENLNMQIGTLKDSESLREKLLQTENHTNQLAKETNKQLKELNNYVRNSSGVNPTNEERQYKIQKERLTNDLVKALNKFQDVQKSTMQKQKESNERARANMNFNTTSDDSIRMQTIGSSQTDQMSSFQNTNKLADFDDFLSSNDQQKSQQQQQQVQISMENDVNLTQLREREAALRKLESDITDVNTIFKDLAVMVHDQGEIIDSIESNVENVQIRVSEANTHLESAKKNQQKARKKKFIFVSILAGVVAVFLLILILSLHPWKS